MVVSSAVDCLPKQGGLSNADRRDSRAGAQLSSSRDRRDERAAAHLPLLREIGWMYEGARADLGPLSRFLGAETRLGFGAWAVGGAGWGAAGDQRERATAIRHAVERGVTFFDTAPSYGAGESERLLGRALKADRARVAIATKVGPRRSEEHTSELQSQSNLVCRLLLEKKKKTL